MFKKLNFALVILLISVLSMIAIGAPQPIGPYYDDSVFVYGDNGLSLNIGISDGYILKVDDADAVVDDYCKLTVNGVVGRGYSEVKIDLSLDSVENTALSTWVGTESITTLGTIVTGTWQGTAIADSYIPNDITINLATLATTLTIVDNENTDESNAILFTSGGVHTGNLNIESDGDLVYNPLTGTLSAPFFAGDGSNLTGVGAAAATALTMTAKAAEDIDKGEVVYISGATGQTPEVSLADNTDSAKHAFCGIAAETKVTGQTILIRVRGELTGLVTDAFLDADILYLSTAGALTKTAPTSGTVEIVGYCSYAHATLGKVEIMHRSAHSIHVPSGVDIVLRMGDNDGAQKVYFKDYANNEVASVNSDGDADFNSLILDTVLAIAEGGTNSGTVLGNDLVIISNAGAIVEGVVTVTELGRLDGLGGIIVTDVTECTDLEGTALSITAGVLNVTEADPTVDTDAEIKAILVDEVIKTGDFTAGRIAKINNATGIIEQGTNTDTDVASAVTHKDLTDNPHTVTYTQVGAEQADAGLTSLAGLTYVSPSFIKVTATDTYVVRTIAEVITDLALDSDDLSDVSSIAMLDEAETIAAEWTFTSFLHLKRLQDIASLGPTFNFNRYRDGDPTSNVSDNDNLGTIYFNGYFTGINDGASIAAFVDGTPGAGDMPTRLHFSTSPDGAASPDLRMAIDNAGNIKMGDGVWTNYINVSNLGVLTLEGTANIEGVDTTEFGYLDGVTSDIQTQINAKKGKNYYSALDSDHTYSDNADIDTQLVGESVVFGDLLYFNWTDKEWKKTDADAEATMPGLRIALETKSDGQTCLMLVKGYIRDDSAFEFAGAMVYASVTPGTMSSTAPTETGDQLQRVGVAKSADILFFDPSIDVGKI